ncbi:TetR/AcrR family transcriptional regulator [Skermania piniformis]
MQARLDAQEEEILRAAIEVLSRDGYRGLSIAEVAAGAGVAVGTVYRHFAGKAELVTTIFRRVAGREVEAVAAAGASGTPAERVRGAIETFAGRALKNPRLAYTLLTEPVDVALDAERLVFRQAFARTFATAIAAGLAEGLLPPQDPQTSAAALVGGLAEVLGGPLADGLDATAVVAEFVGFSLRALGAREQE